MTIINTIKFSHEYIKLQDTQEQDDCLLVNAKKLVLLEVLVVNLEDLSSYFLNYDTDFGTYKLPDKGKYLLLLFQKNSGLMPTLRRWTREKEVYYKSKLGEVFEVCTTKENI